MNVSVNFLAVFLAAAASMVVGFLYYMSPMVSKPWMKLMGYTAASMKADQKKMGMQYSLSFILTLLTAFVMAHVMVFAMDFTKTPFFQTGLITAFWIWIGFVVPVQATDVMFGNKPWNLFFINTGYQLISLLAIGVMLGLMG